MYESVSYYLAVVQVLGVPVWLRACVYHSNYVPTDMHRYVTVTYSSVLIPPSSSSSSDGRGCGASSGGSFISTSRSKSSNFSSSICFTTTQGHVHVASISIVQTILLRPYQLLKIIPATYVDGIEEYLRYCFLPCLLSHLLATLWVFLYVNIHVRNAQLLKLGLRSPAIATCRQ